MLYRPLGSTGEQVSVLGFGCMRLPVIGGRQDRIDVPLATDMLHYAFDHGVNYLDTGYPYHGYSMKDPGLSESFVGDALADGYRDRVILATKLPPMLVETRADMDKILAGQLERLRTDRIDCYLLHGIGNKSWKKLLELGVLEFLDSAQDDGRIRHAGFSFHDEVGVFKEIVDAYDWEFCQIQYNFVDEEFQAGLEGLTYAAARGLGVVVMEPLRGGRLAGRPPADIQMLWDTAAIKRTPAEWGLRYVWNNPGVSTVLSGMSTMEQVVANIEAADGALSGSLTADELHLVQQAREVYQARTVVGCTSCGYCMPCPSGIYIPAVLGQLNSAHLFGDLASEKAAYDFAVEIKATAKASACTRCGQCEEVCTQNLAVADKMEEAAALLE